jgi:glycosyltransferase involved in cell wall biosynthesis
MPLANERRLRLLMGMPHPDSRSGPLACEPQFVEELRHRDVEVDEAVYVFGENIGSPSTIARIRRVARTALRFRKELRAGNYDLVHFNTSADRRAILRDAFTLWLLRRSKAVKFLKIHGSDADLLAHPDWLSRIALKQLVKHTDAIGTLSTEEQNNFIQAGWEKKKTFVVPNVVEPNVNGRSDRLHIRLGISPDVPIFLFIGRFIPAKGLIDVIRACGLVRDRGVRFKLLCVGDGPDRSKAETLVDETNLRPSIQFCGFVPEHETMEYYTNSTALVFPTYHYEGFPMVIFKSVAAGIPIITTRIRAAADYLSEPENCLWVEPRDPRMLAHRMIELVSDTELVMQMRENNRRLAENFVPSKVTDSYLEIYRNVISASCCQS